MTENYGQEVAEKAHDISFAVFRVATLVRHLKLKSELEGAAVLLVSRLGKREPLSRLERLVSLGEATGYIRPVNAYVLLRELGTLRVAIADYEAGKEEVDLEEVFEKQEEPVFKRKNRHSAILDFIRQLPNGCRMRELVQQFPQVSERTLRNDLQSLVSQSLVERVGIQGPNSYFRVSGVAREHEKRDNVTQGGIIAL